MGDLNIDYKTQMTLFETALIHICGTATRPKGTCADTSSGRNVQVLDNVADSVCKTTFVGDNLGHPSLNVFECSRLHTGNTSERCGGGHVAYLGLFIWTDTSLEFLSYSTCTLRSESGNIRGRRGYPSADGGPRVEGYRTGDPNLLEIGIITLT